MRRLQKFLGTDVFFGRTFQLLSTYSQIPRKNLQRKFNIFYDLELETFDCIYRKNYARKFKQMNRIQPESKS